MRRTPGALLAAALIVGATAVPAWGDVSEADVAEARDQLRELTTRLSEEVTGYELAVVEELDLRERLDALVIDLVAREASALFFRRDLSSERLEAATTAAEIALELAPDDPRVHLNLGYFRLWAHRDVEGALAEFERAAGEMTGSAEILDAMADVYIVQGRWEDALSAYQRAIELSPRDAGLVVGEAWALNSLRRYPEAVDASDRAINLAPGSFWPHFYKALSLWGWRGDAGLTRSVLEALPSTEENWPRWSWYWQEVYEGRYRDALGWLESTTEGWIRTKMWMRPNTLLAAYVYERVGEDSEAETAYEHARGLLEVEVEASPEDPRFRSSLGIVYAKQGRHEEAIREGMLACDLLPRSKDGFYYLPQLIDLAHIYTIIGDNEAALERLEYLLANPSFFSAPFLRMDPRWDPLKDDPRFEALLEKYEER